MTITELEKGCGAKGDCEYWGDLGDVCGKDGLCPYCQGQLDGYKLAQKEILEKIKCSDVDKIGQCGCMLKIEKLLSFDSPNTTGEGK